MACIGVAFVKPISSAPLSLIEEGQEKFRRKKIVLFLQLCRTFLAPSDGSLPGVLRRPQLLFVSSTSLLCHGAFAAALLAEQLFLLSLLESDELDELDEEPDDESELESRFDFFTSVCSCHARREKWLYSAESQNTCCQLR